MTGQPGLNCDRFTPDAGLVDGPCRCGVCGADMLVKRGRQGPRTSIEAMSGGKSYYDEFLCPHRDELWHRQAKRLRAMAKETPSGVLRRFYSEEADGVLRTKEVSNDNPNLESLL